MDNNFFLSLLEKNQIENILNTNEYTNKFGLSISEADAKLLVQERKKNLKEQQRIEFGEGILNKLIYAFCDSEYIYQDNFVETILRLQEIFYTYKNETLDEISDDELIEYMEKAFNGICQGSLEYLEETSLEDFARNIREGQI